MAFWITLCPSQTEVCTSLQSSRGSVAVFMIPGVSSIFQAHDKKNSTVYTALSQPMAAIPDLFLSCICTISTTVIPVPIRYRVKFRLLVKNIQKQSKIQLLFKFTQIEWKLFSTELSWINPEINFNLNICNQKHNLMVMFTYSFKRKYALYILM